MSDPTKDNRAEKERLMHGEIAAGAVRTRVNHLPPCTGRASTEFETRLYLHRILNAYVKIWHNRQSSSLLHKRP
jgi:hypothetical protein